MEGLGNKQNDEVSVVLYIKLPRVDPEKFQRDMVASAPNTDQVTIVYSLLWGFNLNSMQTDFHHHYTWSCSLTLHRVFSGLFLSLAGVWMSIVWVVLDTEYIADSKVSLQDSGQGPELSSIMTLEKFHIHCVPLFHCLYKGSRVKSTMKGDYMNY